MSMPKGYKVKGGYATVADDLGIGYREIADEMTASGYKMNHSTARNVFLSAMRKLAKDVCTLYECDTDQEKIEEIASDPRFQSSISDILSD
tara:strand:+ start:1300 stop:1572 length:273 start_codon:yes stop_codon:yes gene_type:complete